MLLVPAQRFSIGVILPHGDMQQCLGVFLIVMAGVGGHRLVPHPPATWWVEAGDAAEHLQCPGWTPTMRD